MIHLYLTLPDPEPPGATILVEEILAHDAGVGLVQTAAGDDEENMRRVAGSHIRACDGVVAISDGALQPRQAWEIEAASAAGIPVLVIPMHHARTGMAHRRPRLDPKVYVGFIGQLQKEPQTVAGPHRR